MIRAEAQGKGAPSRTPQPGSSSSLTKALSLALNRLACEVRQVVRPGRESNSPENLRTLCPACHTRWHWRHGKRAWRRHSPTCVVCERRARRLGLCETHRTRLLRHGHPCLVKRRSGRTWQLVVDRGPLSGLEFQELLRGFPLGWTDLEDSATLSSRRSPSGSVGD